MVVANIIVITKYTNNHHNYANDVETIQELQNCAFMG